MQYFLLSYIKTVKQISFIKSKHFSAYYSVKICLILWTGNNFKYQCYCTIQWLPLTRNHYYLCHGNATEFFFLFASCHPLLFLGCSIVLEKQYVSHSIADWAAKSMEKCLKKVFDKNCIRKKNILSEARFNAVTLQTTSACSSDITTTLIFQNTVLLNQQHLNETLSFCLELCLINRVCNCTAEHHSSVSVYFATFNVFHTSAI